MRNTAARAAHAAGAVIRAAMDRPLEVHNKGRIDLVTQVDLAAEAAIVDVLQAETPDIPILAEEGGGTRGPDRWIVDPLDGTTNFVHGFPAFAVSIALMRGGRLLEACILDPLRNELYQATLGGGATCNGRPIRVSETSALESALLLTGFAYDRRERADEYLYFFKHFLERTHGIRRAGAAALDFTHIAAGRADGFWEFGLQTWDVAAGTLLVTEAGGQVSDMRGGPLDLEAPRVLATNGKLHPVMTETLQRLLSSVRSALGQAQE